MIDIPTVFILGAGASTPYGFPLASKLRKYIISDNFRRNYAGYFTRSENQQNNEGLPPPELMERMIRIFDNSDIKSIDFWLARNSDYLPCGKTAIVRSILIKEDKKLLREGSVSKEGNWYTEIFNSIIEGCYNFDDIDFSDGKISFITFNYDRSLEYYLYNSLRASFNRIQPSKIIDKLKQLPIIHVYGGVGSLPWQNEIMPVEYGIGEVSPDIFCNLSSNIQIMIEEIEPERIKAINKLISNASRIFFLGIGYHPENLKLLNLEKHLNSFTQVYGTGIGLSLTKREKLRKKFIRYDDKSPNILNNDKNVKIEGMNCLELIREFL